MLNLTKAVRQLKKEREQARRKLEQLDTALKALSGVSGMSRASVRGPMSGAARKRIAAAQRARWAKWKAANPRK